MRLRTPSKEEEVDEVSRETSMDVEGNHNLNPHCVAHGQKG